MRVALVHDWLTGLRGGEKCLLSFLSIFPDADIFTLVHAPGATDPLIDEHVRGTSLLNQFPGVRRYYRALLPLFPVAARSMRVEGYDLVISLSHAAAKNVAVTPGTCHVCYCFTPMRYIWDQQQFYFGALTPLLWPLTQSLRRWDVQGAKRVSHFVAISRFVAARIRAFYGRRAAVIYPSVDTSWIAPAVEGSSGGSFLYAGALVPYKRVDRLVESFNRSGRQLQIAGTGPEYRALRRLALRNVSFLGAVSNVELAELYRNARALLFPGKEDFGMVPVECMAAGRPIIGLAAGGLRETVVSLTTYNHLENPNVGATGILYPPGRTIIEELDYMERALALFERKEDTFKVADCVRQARRFSPQVFAQSWHTFASASALPGYGVPRMTPGEAHSSAVVEM